MTSRVDVDTQSGCDARHTSSSRHALILKRMDVKLEGIAMGARARVWLLVTLCVTGALTLVVAAVAAACAA